MYTDGGSIPRPVRGLAGFSPWGYGPAYIVHDWIFNVHVCGIQNRLGELSGKDEERIKAVRNIDLQTSADILLASIDALAEQNLVPPRKLAPQAIYAGVSSFVARQIWNSNKAANCKPVPQAKLDEIEATLRQPGSSLRILRNAPNVGKKSALPRKGAPVLVYQANF